MEDLGARRKVYEKDKLEEQSVPENPMELFRNWYLEAEKNPLISEANAMSVSTIEDDGCPRTRMVLLKKYGAEGFIFYTNYDSRKGKSLQKNPKCCLHFFWPGLERQIIIKAKTEKVPENISDGYFHSRPKGSQIGALISPQSQEIPSRNFLEEKLKEADEFYQNKDVPRPENWGGILAVPYEIEFWQGRPNRLHDRILYSLQEDFSWKISRLAP